MKGNLLFVTVLLIVSVGSMTVAAEIAPPDRTESDVTTLQDAVDEKCMGSTGTQVRALTQTGKPINEVGSGAIYEQTELTVLVCEDGEKVPRDRWNFVERDGFEIDSVSDRQVIIVVTNPATFDLSIDIDGDSTVNLKSEVTEPDRITNNDAKTDILGVTLQLQSNDIKNKLDQRMRALNENRTALQEAIGALETQPEVSEDTSISRMNQTVTHIRTIRTHYQNVNRNMAVIETILYEQANKTVGPTNMTKAMSNLQTEQEKIANDTNNTIINKDKNLKEAASSLRMSVATNVGIGALGGMLIGFIVGAIIPYRKGKEVNDFYQVSSQNEFTSDVLKIPVIFGLLLLIGGILAMAWVGILGVMT